MDAFDRIRKIDTAALLVTLGRFGIAPILLTALLTAGFAAGAPPFALERLHGLHLLAITSALVLFWCSLPERMSPGSVKASDLAPFTLWYNPLALIVVVILLVNIGGGASQHLAYFWTVLLLDALLVAYAFRNLVRRQPRLAAGIFPAALLASLAAALFPDQDVFFTNHAVVLLCFGAMAALIVFLSIGPMGPVRWGVTMPLFIIGLLFLYGEGPPVRQGADVWRPDIQRALRWDAAGHAIWGIGAGQSPARLQGFDADIDLVGLDYLPDRSMAAWVRQSEMNGDLFGQRSATSPAAETPLYALMVMELGGVGMLAILALFLATLGGAIYAVATREATGETLLLSGLAALMVGLIYSAALVPGPLLPSHVFLAAGWVGLVKGLTLRTLRGAPQRRVDAETARGAIMLFASGGLLAALFVFFTALPLIGRSMLSAKENESPETSVERLERAAILNPFSCEIAFRKARLQTDLLMQQEDYDEYRARRWWSRAVQCDPYDARAYVVWARFLLEAAEPAKAREVVELGRLWRPNSLLLALWEAEVYRRMSDWEQEEKARRRALQLARGEAGALRPMLLEQLESTYLRANAEEQALLAACQVFQLDPTNLFAALRVKQLGE